MAAGADAKTDAAAKAKAEDVLKQLKAGGNWDELAKKYSDDPAARTTGGELGFAQRGRMVPEFDNAIFTQKIGDIAIVKSQFGYHVVQVEERQTAHTQPFNEVLPTIQATLCAQKAAAGRRELCAGADIGSRQERPGEDGGGAHLAAGDDAARSATGRDCRAARAARSFSPRPSKPSRARRRSTRRPAKATRSFR